MKGPLVAGLLIGPLASFALGGCVPELGGGHAHVSSGAEAKRRLVHVDHVDPAKTSQFEEARRELLAAYAAKGLREGTTTLIETKDAEGRPEFFSLRPFGAYAEIDTLNDAAAARAAAIGMELERLDAMTHATLVPPHASEIWLFHPELSYSPPGAPGESDASAARLTFEEVAPPAEDEYEAAVKGVTGALARTKAPIARLAFSSSYGTGELVTLWAARAAADLGALETPGSELGLAIEKERGKTVKSETRVAFVRRELSSP